MVLYLVSCTLLVIAGTAVGTAILLAIEREPFFHSGDRLVTAIWLGLLTMASSLLALSIVTRLSPRTSLILIILLTVGATSLKAVRQDIRASVHIIKTRLLFVFALLAVAAAWDAAGLVEAYDTGLYHYQLTRWLSQFGTIPGLALLHHELGLSSSWFALAAPFDVGPFRGRISGLLDGLAIFLSFAHFGLVLSRVLQRRANRADWFLLGGYSLLFPVCFAWAFEVSLSPDVPIWILTVLTAWLMLVSGYREVDRDNRSRLASASILPLVMASCATAVKFSAVPVLIVAGLFYWFNSREHWTRRLVSGSVASLVAVPVFVANAVSSGYPFYPNPIVRLPVSWVIDRADGQEFAKGIRDWARWGGPAPSWATGYNWILPWILHPDKLLLIAFCVVCLLAFSLMRGWQGCKPSLYILALSLLGTAFVFTNAPNPRFGLGYLGLYPALLLATIGPSYWGFATRWLPHSWNKQGSMGYVVAGLAVVVIVTGSLRELHLMRRVSGNADFRMPANSGFVSRLVLPPVLPSYSGDLVIVKNRASDSLRRLELVTDHSNGIEYQHPVMGDQCWAAALPCTSTSLAGDVRLRNPDNGFRSGFVR
jgi:hypothetical protein